MVRSTDAKLCENKFPYNESEMNSDDMTVTVAQA